MTDLHLHGCRPEPLGSYLGALGVLRSVSEQIDAGARGWWQGDHFVLRSSLSRETLSEFLLDRYAPTPIVAPWNGGSGFGEKDQQAGIAAIERSDSPRLASYRAAIAIARALVAEASAAGWEKADLVEVCRARFPDAAVPWVDAAVVLGSDRLVFPPILGTGGNSGRLEFSNVFMQHLADVLSLSPSRRRGGGSPGSWLADALFGEGGSPLAPAPIGQFDPGAAGGVNSAPSGAAQSLVNPWGYVLLIEGALLFASAAARRLGAQGRGFASVPFTVDASPVGFSSSSAGERTRGEVWAPVWRRPAAFSELAALIGEGRAEWRGRQATRGVDMAKAIASLGTQRGIDLFVRHSIVERFGQTMLAVPTGRIPVRRQIEVGVAAQIDPWLETVRRGTNRPAAIVAALHRVDAALFEFCTRGGKPSAQAVLQQVARLEHQIGRSESFRSAAKGLQPVSPLPAADWLPVLDDGSPELRVAAALASGRDPDGTALALLLRPIAWDASRRRFTWSPSGSVVPGLDRRPLPDVLADAHVRRGLELAGSGSPKGESSVVGVQTAYYYRIPAPASDVAKFAGGALDERRVGELLHALLLLDWRDEVDVEHWFDGEPAREPVDPAWALLAPFFHGREMSIRRVRRVGLVPDASWPTQLAHGRVADVVASAIRRLRVARLVPVFDHAGLIGGGRAAGHRLAAALLCPLSTVAASRLVARLVVDPDPDH